MLSFLCVRVSDTDNQGFLRGLVDEKDDKVSSSLGLATGRVQVFPKDMPFLHLAVERMCAEDFDNLFRIDVMVPRQFVQDVR